MRKLFALWGSLKTAPPNNSTEVNMKKKYLSITLKKDQRNCNKVLPYSESHSEVGLSTGKA
jgi:hypothetical protein